MTVSQHLAVQHRHDEIDLVQLLRALWAQKLLIVLVSLASFAGAAAYAFLATPQYQVQSVLRPVTAKDLDWLNSTGLIKLSPDEALKLVGAKLESYDNRLAYFRENKSFFESSLQSGQTLEQTFENFNRGAFKTLQPDPKKTDSLSAYVGLELSYSKGLDGASLLNNFIDFTIKAEQEKVISDLRTLIANRLQQLDLKIEAARVSYITTKDTQIAMLLEADRLNRAKLQDELSALRQQLRQQRDNRIMQLDEAIRIASSLGISKPTTPSALGASGQVTQGNVMRTEVNNQQIPLYFMGSEALEAERKALLKRKSDDFTEPRVAQIQQELRLLQANRQVEVLKQRQDEDLFLKDLAVWREAAARLKSIDLTAGQLHLAIVDRKALEPLSPAKPRKTLILALGLVLGGMLGIFLALVRHALVRRSESMRGS